MIDNIILPPNSKAISLTRGKSAIVDTENYEWLNQWRWFCDKDCYAIGGVPISSLTFKRKTVRMHRIIIDAPKGILTDHINGNRLDNRRCNLRLCNAQENVWNQLPIRGHTSKYKGVSWSIRDEFWYAHTRLNYKTIYLGIFRKETDAALAYNKFALEHHGEFARLNIIE